MDHMYGTVHLHIYGCVRLFQANLKRRTENCLICPLNDRIAISMEAKQFKIQSNITTFFNNYRLITCVGLFRWGQPAT